MVACDNYQLHMIQCFRKSCNSQKGVVKLIAMTTPRKLLKVYKKLNWIIMTSCEQHRSSAYSEDLRWRIVWQRFALAKKVTEIAENLSVDQSIVSRILQLFCNTG